MDSAATVSLLYDTLDSLVALKLDLMAAEQHDPPLPPDRRRRMWGDIDHSIANIRGVLETIEGRRVRITPPPAED